MRGQRREHLTVKEDSMRERSWFLVPRRESGYVQRANDMTIPLVDRIKKLARPGKAAKVRSARKGQWIERAAKRRTK